MEIELQLTYSSQNQEIVTKNIQESTKMPYSGKSRRKSHFQLWLSKVVIIKLREVLLTSTG